MQGKQKEIWTDYVEKQTEFVHAAARALPNPMGIEWVNFWG
jgi:hypothetical protein